MPGANVAGGLRVRGCASGRRCTEIVAAGSETGDAKDAPVVGDGLVIDVAGELADPVAVGDVPESNLDSGGRIAVLVQNAAGESAKGREPEDEPGEVLGRSESEESSFAARLAGAVLIHVQIPARTGG